MAIILYNCLNSVGTPQNVPSIDNKFEEHIFLIRKSLLKNNILFIVFEYKWSYRRKSLSDDVVRNCGGMSKVISRGKGGVVLSRAL
jgi:hypothetical protein